MNTDCASHSDKEQKRADIEQKRADIEQKRADIEQKRADKEQNRVAESATVMRIEPEVFTPELFGAHLCSIRGERGLGLNDIFRQTKIPERVLRNIESGAFDRLPAEVFVRGFIRAYASCVGASESDLLGKYAAALAAKSHMETFSGSFSGNSAGGGTQTGRLTRTARGASDQGASDQRASGGAFGSERCQNGHENEQSAVSRASSSLDETGARMSVTVAVIILVIVATLTLSVLLKNTSERSGDGVAQLVDSVSQPSRSAAGLPAVAGLSAVFGHSQST